MKNKMNPSAVTSLVNKTLLCLGLLAANTLSAQVQVISWHWNGSRSAGSTAFGTIPAGGYAGLPGVVSVTHWNQSTGNMVNLVDSTGAATGVGIAIQNSGWYSIQNFLPAQDADGSYNKVMLNTYPDSYSSGGNNNFTLTNIPYSSYTIYVYFSRDSSSAGYVGIIGSTTNYCTTMGSSANAGTSAAFVQTTSPTSALSPQADYAIFTGLSGATQVIVYHNGTSGDIAGIQVVNTGSPVLPPPPAPLDTWQGNTDANWNTAANWLTNATGHMPPANYDSVLFALAGSSGSTLNNNISSLTLNSMTINSGASAFTFTGDALTLTNGLIDNASADQTIGLVLAGLGGVTASGGGTLTLTANNTYTGPTTIANSSLNIGGSTPVGSISPSSALTLGGPIGGTVTYSTTGGAGQTFNGVTLAGGGWVLNNSVAGTTMALNALSHTAGGGGDVKFPAAAAGAVSTTTVNQNGIIGGWAVIDNGNGTYSWASSAGAGPILAATAITPALAANTNWAPTSAASVTNSTNINSLIINSGADITLGSGVTLTNGSAASGGGIIFAGAGNDTLGVGGTGALVSGSAGGDLYLYCPSSTGTLTIGVPIVNNGTNVGSLVKDGPGSVVAATNNSYTGGTFVYGGSLTLSLYTNAAVGANISVANGATLVFSNNGTGSPFALSGGAVQGSGTLVITAPNGTPAVGLSIIRMSNPETVALKPGSLIDVEYGALRNDNGNSAWNNNYASAFINTNGMMDVWDGYMQVDALNGYGVISHGWGPGSATFAMGANNGTGSFYGIISNNFAQVNGIYGGSTNTGGSLGIVKLGTGAENLYGTNYYQGNTTVSNGTLAIGGAGVLWSQQSPSSTLTPAYTGNINVANTTSIFNYASSQNQTLAGGSSGAGLLEWTGTGALALAGGTYASVITNSTAAALWIIGSNVTTTVSGSLYSAVVVSNSSTLVLYGNQAQAKNVTVNDGGGLTANFVGASSWSPASLTLGNSAGCTLNFAALTNSGGAAAVINPVSLTLHGAVTVNINSYNDPNLAAGSTYPLLANAGAIGSYTLGNQPLGWLGHLAVNGTTLDFVVDSQDVKTKAATGTDLTAGASWVQGSVPTPLEPAIWNSTVPSLGAGLTLAANEAWSSINVSGAASDISITGAGVLTNGNINLAGVNMNFGIATNVLSGSPIWTIASGETLTVTNPVLGSGTLTVAGGGTAVFDSAGRTSTTIVSNATAIFNTVIAGSSYTLYNNATLLFTNNGANLAPSGGTFSGSGTLRFTAPASTPGINPTTIFRFNNTETVALNAGSLIDVEGGWVRNDNGNSAWAGNFASAFVQTNAVLDAWDGYMQVDALNGYGLIEHGWGPGSGTFAMGAANGNGAFYGIISNNFNIPGNTSSGGNSGTGTLTINKLGTGTQILYGTNTWTGNTIIYNGTLMIGGAGMMLAQSSTANALGNYGGTINLVGATSIFNYASSQNETNTGPVIGAGGLVVSGAGTLTLTGANTYTGNTTISGAGSLVLSPSGSGTLAGNVNGTGTGVLMLAGSGVTTISGKLNAATVVANGGTLALASTQTGTGAVTLNSGCKLNMNILGASQWAPASLTLGNATLNFNGITNSHTTLAPINPGASVTRTGTVTVNVNNTADLNIAVGSSYPLLGGVTSTNGYTLGAQPVGWIGYLAVSGNTLVYTTTLEYDIWDNASGNNLWDVGVSTNWVGNAVLNSTAGTFKNNDNALFVDSTVTSNQTITVSGAVSPAALVGANNTRTFTVNSSAGNDITGPGGLTMIGTGTVALSGGANTYSGATTINAGSVNIGSFGSNNVPSDVGQPNSTDPGYLVLNGGTLNYGGVTASTDRGITANGGALGVTNSASTLTLNGLIAGPGTFTKTGSGTLLLNNNNANTYSGGTTVGGGTLQFGSVAALGAGTNVNVSGGATLDVAGQTLPSTMLVTMSNHSTLKNSGAATTNYAKIFFPTPAAQSANGGLSDGGFILAGNSSTIYWLDSGGYPDWDCTNNISGTLDLVGTNDNSGMMLFNMGGGTVLLDKSTGSAASAGSANSVLVYNGGLVREAGNQPHQLYSGGQILIDNGGTFDLNGMGETSGGLNSDAGNTNGLLVNNGTALSTLTLTGSGTYNGTIKDGTGQIAIVKSTGGAETISGTNLFTGGITVSAGTLTYGYGEANSPIFNYPVTLNGGTANFNLSGNYTWNDSTISGTGTLGVQGTNMVLTLSSYLQNFSGNVAVNAGTFHVIGDSSGNPMIGGGITIANNSGATFIADVENYQPTVIGGSLTCNAASTVILNFDGSNGAVLQMGGGIAAGGANLQINVVGAPLGQNVYTLMTATNITGTFNFNPASGLSGGLGLNSPTLTAYVTTSASAVVLHVVQTYLWVGGNAPNNNWSYRLNWNPLAPESAGQLATLGTENSYTPITLDKAETIGAIQFNNTDSFGIVGANTLTLDNAGNGAQISVLAGTSNSIAVPVSLADSSGVLGVTASGGALVNVSGVISGNAGVAMSGGGTLVLSGANTFNNSVTINGGTVKLGNALALGSAVTNTVGNNGTLDLNGQTVNPTPTNTIVMLTGATLANSSATPATLNQVVNQAAGTVNYIRGSGNITLSLWQNPNLNGQMDVTNYNTGTIDLVGTADNAYTVIHNFAGTVLLDKTSSAAVHALSFVDVEGGIVRMAGTGDVQVYPGNPLTVNAGIFDMAGHNQTVGTLVGSATAGVISNSAANTTSTLTVSGAGGTFNGTIKDGAGKMALLMTASTTLGGTNSFSGGLTVNGGTTTLALATLSTNLPVTVASGAVLSLGFSATNQVASLTLAGASKPNGVYNSANTGGLIAGTGALRVGPLTVGPTGPANLTNSVVGNTLTLSWPSGLGWRLVSQTNSLSTGLNPSSAAWGTVPGASDGSATISLNPTNPAVFYKLVYP